MVHIKELSHHGDAIAHAFSLAGSYKIKGLATHVFQVIVKPVLPAKHQVDNVVELRTRLCRTSGIKRPKI